MLSIALDLAAPVMNKQQGAKIIVARETLDNLAPWCDLTQGSPPAR